jgi:hypothetical protein
MAPKLDPLLRIERMYHFTDVRNLPRIRGHRGIYSTVKLRELNIEFEAGGNKWSLEQDIRFGMHQYVHLCWARGHPMAWHITQRDSTVRLKYLEIDRSILYEPGVVFSPGIANAVGMELFPIQNAVKNQLIDYDAFYGNIGSLRESGPQARRQAAEKSEILVPDFVSMKFIRNLPNG